MVSKADKQKERILNFMYERRVKDSIENIEFIEIAEAIRHYEPNQKYRNVAETRRGTDSDNFTKGVVPRYLKSLKDDKLIKNEEKGIYSLTRKGWTDTRKNRQNRITLRKMDKDKFKLEIDTYNEGMKLTFFSKDETLNNFLEDENSKQSNYELYDLLAKSFQTMAQLELATKMDDKQSLEKDQTKRKNLIQTTETTFQEFLRHQASNLNYIADKLKTLDENTRDKIQNVFIEGLSPTDYLVEALTGKIHEYLDTHSKIMMKYPDIVEEYTELFSKQNEVIFSILGQIQESTSLTSKDIESFLETVSQQKEVANTISKEMEEISTRMLDGYKSFIRSMPLIDSTQKIKEINENIKEINKKYPVPKQ